MTKMLAAVFQVSLFILISPLLSGLVTKIKNNLRMRRGQSVLQPYYNLAKLFSKGEVVSGAASWIFRVTPFVVLASVLAAALLIPLFGFYACGRSMGDFLSLVFIFSLGRFFLALAALDTGSSFGGMGSSREMFISGLAEPALCLIIFSLSMQFGSTDISIFNMAHAVSVSSIFSAAALLMVIIAETSRVPVDNQETHLELTMIHEAMVLEYSGRSLALIELASYVKQMVWFILLAGIIFPVSFSGVSVFSAGALAILWYLAGIALIVFTVALIEISVAKMRLFRVADFLGFAFVLGIIAVLCANLGV